MSDVKFYFYSAYESERQDEPMFWSKETGWGSLETATPFTFEEGEIAMDTGHMPVGTTAFVNEDVAKSFEQAGERLYSCSGDYGEVDMDFWNEDEGMGDDGLY